MLGASIHECETSVSFATKKASLANGHRLVVIAHLGHEAHLVVLTTKKEVSKATLVREEASWGHTLEAKSKHPHTDFPNPHTWGDLGNLGLILGPEQYLSNSLFRRSLGRVSGPERGRKSEKKGGD